MRTQNMNEEERDDFDLKIGMIPDTIMPGDDDFIPEELRGRTAPSWYSQETSDPSTMGAMFG